MESNIKENLIRSQYYTASIVFLTGAIIHTISLIIGREKFLQYIFTPIFDSIFGIPMAYAGIMGIFFRKKLFPKPLWKRIFYVIGVFYLLISIPLHIQTIITQDTTYITKFPEEYSYFVIPIMLFFTWFFVTQIRIAEEPK